MGCCSLSSFTVYSLLWPVYSQSFLGNQGHSSSKQGVAPVLLEDNVELCLLKKMVHHSLFCCDNNSFLSFHAWAQIDILIALFLLRIYKTQKSFEQEACVPCRKYSCMLNICLSRLARAAACWGHVERGWLCVRSHGESACRYIGLPGGKLAARGSDGLSLGCSISLGTSD